MEVYILLSKCSAIPIIWQHFMYFMSLANERCGKVRLLTIAAYIERHFELKIQVGKLYVIRCSWFFCTCFQIIIFHVHHLQSTHENVHFQKQHHYWEASHGNSKCQVTHLCSQVMVRISIESSTCQLYSPGVSLNRARTNDLDSDTTLMVTFIRCRQQIILSYLDVIFQDNHLLQW